MVCASLRALTKRKRSKSTYLTRCTAKILKDSHCPLERSNIVVRSRHNFSGVPHLLKWDAARWHHKSKQITNQQFFASYYGNTNTIYGFIYLDRYVTELPACHNETEGLASDVIKSLIMRTCGASYVGNASLLRWWFREKPAALVTDSSLRTSFTANDTALQVHIRG